MVRIKSLAPVAAVIGDVVGSRAYGDRGALHRRLEEALVEANRSVGPDATSGSALRITVGDEFQGAFADVGTALAVTTRLRLALLPEVDVRFGIGWGAAEVLGQNPRVEDGPAWWAARDAIVAVVEEARRPAHRRRRTAYHRADGAPGPDPAAVNAALVCRDELLGALSARSLGVLRGLLEEKSQREIAEEVGITPSAVSQRVRRDGLAALAQAERLMGDIR